MKILLSICLILGLALSVNCVRVKTHTKSHLTGSWQSYLEDALIDSGQVSAGVLLGLNGDIWASSNLNLKAGEAAAIITLFENPSNVMTTGVNVGGLKYVGVKGDENSIYGKKGATGVIIAKTLQTIVIGVYNERQQPHYATHYVEKMADYLRENGF